MRSGLSSALTRAHFQDISAASSFREAAMRLTERKFDLAIIDQHLGDGAGLDLAKVRALSNPECILLMLSLEEEWDLVDQVRAIGFSSFISKRCEMHEIIEVLYSLLAGDQHFYLRVPQIKARRENSRNQMARLTTTEQEILIELSDGSSTREIALRRCNSQATIKSHLSSIYRKLGARNRVEALNVARDFKLISG